MVDALKVSQGKAFFISLASSRPFSLQLSGYQNVITRRGQKTVILFVVNEAVGFCIGGYWIFEKSAIRESVSQIALKRANRFDLIASCLSITITLSKKVFIWGVI